MPGIRKVKKKIKGYSYVRKGKRIRVPAHVRTYRKKDLTPLERRLLKEGRADELFYKKSKKSQAIDRKYNSDVIFTEPNKDWVLDMNRSDVKGIDTVPVRRGRPRKTTETTGRKPKKKSTSTGKRGRPRKK